MVNIKFTIITVIQLRQRKELYKAVIQLQNIEQNLFIFLDLQPNKTNNLSIINLNAKNIIVTLSQQQIKVYKYKLINYLSKSTLLLFDLKVINQATKLRSNINFDPLREMINNFYRIGSLSKKSLQNSHLFGSSIKFGYLPNTSKGNIFYRFSNNSKFSTTKQNYQYSQLQKQQNIEKGFLSMFTYYFVTHINNDRLFEGKDNFDTIRERLLKQKDKFYIAKKGGLNPKNVDQYFAAFEIGKGVELDDSIFNQKRLVKGRFKSDKNSVFNITSITQKIFIFTKESNTILIGSVGIGKTWGHVCLNYLSSMVLKCIICDKELKRIKQLINLYFAQFLNIHKQNNNKDQEANINQQLLIEEFKTFPIELFIQLKAELTWQELVNNLHAQFPQINLTQLKQLSQKSGQSDQAYEQRVYNYKRLWALKFFINMSNKFKQYKKKYYPNINFVINVDQANIYFENLRAVVSLIQKKYNLNMKPILSQQDKKDLDTIKAQLRQRQYMSKQFENILSIMMSKVGQYIKLNCSDQINSNIVAEQAIYLNQQSRLFINLFKHQFPDEEQISHGINLQTQVGLKEMWSMLWFQFQKNIIGTNKTQAFGIRYLKQFKDTLEQLNLRKKFNQIFYKKTQQEKNIKLKKFFARFYSLRLLFSTNKIIRQGLLSLLKMIHQYLKKKIQHQILQQLEQQQIKKQILKNFQLFVGNCYIQCIKMDTKISSIRTKKAYSDNSKEMQKQKKLLFLIKLRTLLKEKEKLLIKNNNKNQLDNIKIVLSYEDVSNLQTQIISLLGNYSSYIIQQLINTQYMQYTSKKQLIIHQSFDDFFQRIDNIQLDDTFIVQYIKWVCFSEEENVNQTQFDRRMTYLLSQQSCKLLFDKEEFNIVNNDIKHWFTHHNSTIKRENIFKQNLIQIQKALKSIKLGETLGFRPADQPSDKKLMVHSATNPDYQDIKYSRNSIWFDLILARKGESKNQLISIDFSLGEIQNIKTKINNITDNFYNNFIKDNDQFQRNFTYSHWIICRQSIKDKLQLENKSFIKIISVNDIQFESKKFGSEQRLRALCDLERVKQERT